MWMELMQAKWYLVSFKNKGVVDYSDKSIHFVTLPIDQGFTAAEAGGTLA